MERGRPLVLFSSKIDELENGAGKSAEVKLVGSTCFEPGTFHQWVRYWSCRGFLKPIYGWVLQIHEVPYDSTSNWKSEALLKLNRKNFLCRPILTDAFQTGVETTICSWAISQSYLSKQSEGTQDGRDLPCRCWFQVPRPGSHQYRWSPWETEGCSEGHFPDLRLGMDWSCCPQLEDDIRTWTRRAWSSAPGGSWKIRSLVELNSPRNNPTKQIESSCRLEVQRGKSSNSKEAWWKTCTSTFRFGLAMRNGPNYREGRMHFHPVPTSNKWVLVPSNHNVH